MKKKLIIGVLVLLVIGVSSFLIINNNEKKKNDEEFNKQKEVYDRYTKIAERINDIINGIIKPLEEAVLKDIGDDKTKIDELNSKKEELLKYVININSKEITDLNELKESTKKLEESLKNVDEKLIDLKENEIKNYTLNEENPINEISDEITKLIEEVNTLAKKQAEKKAKEELKQKILSGDLSSFEGKYKMGENNYLTIKNNAFVFSGAYSKTYKTSEMKKITQEKDGSYKFLVLNETLTLIYGDKFDSETFFQISTDSKEVTFCEGLGCDLYTKQ